jgi:hypothetical protein
MEAGKFSKEASLIAGGNVGGNGADRDFLVQRRF